MNGDNKIKQAYKSILSNDYEQAIVWFHQAVNDEPDNADYHYRLSITYSRSNKLLLAVQHAKLAVELQPEQLIYQYHYRNVKSRELVQEAGQNIEYRNPNLNWTVVLLNKAIALDALNLEAYMLLGVAYTGLRKTSLAVAAYKEALNLDPNRDDVKALIWQLDQNPKLINH